MAFCISFDKLLSFHQFALVIKFPFYGWPCSIVAIWNPKQHVQKASHRGSKQQ